MVLYLSVPKIILTKYVIFKKTHITFLKKQNALIHNNNNNI